MGRLGLILTVILLCVVITHVDGRGGGRGGGGRGGGGRSISSRGSSSRSRGSSNSRSRGSSSRSSSSSRSRSSSRTTKYKSASKFSPATRKAMKTAALVGVGAYVGMKLTKVRGHFRGYGGGWYHLGNGRWDYDEWRDLASTEGFLCRDDRDCAWLDPGLECDDHKLTFVPGTAWFGGSEVSIRGKCECGDDFWWDDDDLQCQMWSNEGLAVWAIILIVIAVLVICCCCFICIRRRR